MLASVSLQEGLAKTQRATKNKGPFIRLKYEAQANLFNKAVFLISHQMISKDTIDRIFEATIIEEVVGDFVALKRAGRNYRGLSPFTNEKTPSFYVVPTKGIYKCFSSGKGGNAVSFLMEHEKLTYPEALRYLAKKYNIEIEEEQQNPDELQAKSERESLGVIVNFAQLWFEKQLWEEEEGQNIGLSYFRERGFRDDIIKKFGLGYNPNAWDSFSQSALKSGFKAELLEKTGLSRFKDDKPSDFFRGRVMFPIRNVTGKTIGFGGRTLLADKKVAKYFNSPESEIYHKSKVLYGIDLAKPEILKQDNCYLVEGYTDVISMYQAGVENVVSSSGTALTEDQIKLIKRFTKNVTILYDGDPAGIRASFRGIDLLLREGMQIRVVLFPDGDDPDSYSKKVGSAAFQQYVQEASKDFIVFKTDVLSADAAGDPLKRAEMIRDVVSSIAQIPDGIQRSVYTQECSRILDIPEQTLILEISKQLREKLKRQSHEAPPDFPPAPPADDYFYPAEEKVAVSELFHQERDLLRLMLNYGNCAINVVMHWLEDGTEISEEVKVSVAEYILSEMFYDGLSFENPKLKAIAQEYDAFLKEGKFPEEKYFTQHIDPEISGLAADLLSEEHTLSHNWDSMHQIFTESELDNLRAAARDSLNRLKINVLIRMCDEIDAQLQNIQNMDPRELELILKRKIKINQAKIHISKHFQTVILK